MTNLSIPLHGFSQQLVELPQPSRWLSLSIPLYGFRGVCGAPRVRGLRSFNSIVWILVLLGHRDSESSVRALSIPFYGFMDCLAKILRARLIPFNSIVWIRLLYLRLMRRKLLSIPLYGFEDVEIMFEYCGCHFQFHCMDS